MGGGMWNVLNLFNVATTGVVSTINFVLSPNLRTAPKGRGGQCAAGELRLLARTGIAEADLTVQFDPYQARISLAYPQIRWDPARCFSRYNAYTSRLDDAQRRVPGRTPRALLRAPGECGP